MGDVSICQTGNSDINWCIFQENPITIGFKKRILESTSDAGDWFLFTKADKSAT